MRFLVEFRDMAATVLASGAESSVLEEAWHCSKSKALARTNTVTSTLYQHIEEPEMKKEPKTNAFSHVGSSGEARMVDVGAKDVTDRVATARGVIRMRPGTLAAIEANSIKKGDVLAVARVAGILAAKRTAELIPLCHPLPLSDLQIELRPAAEIPGIVAEATARATWKTGVEMEALTAVTVSLLTVYDMVKSLDREMELDDISLVQKSGGKLGNWSRG